MLPPIDVGLPKGIRRTAPRFLPRPKTRATVRSFAIQ